MSSRLTRRLVRPSTSALKRSVDVTASTIGLAILSPVLALVALLVRGTLGSPVLFRQRRPGRAGEPFTMVKFRTMVDACDVEGHCLSDADRLTPLGASLRRTSLDELPELWNVLKGDMTLVGPRPLLLRYTPFFNETERARLTVRPGITGWAQINGRNNTAWSDRLAMDVWYVKNQSFALDVKILTHTLLQVVRRRGAIADPSSAMMNLDDERRSEVPGL